MLPRRGSEHHLLNSHVHPHLGIVEVAEAIRRSLWTPVGDQSFHSLEALTAGGQQPGRGAREASVKLPVAVGHADIAGLRAADRVT